MAGKIGHTGDTLEARMHIPMKMIPLKWVSMEWVSMKWVSMKWDPDEMGLHPL